MAESTGLHETLKCMICLDFADQAVETTCYHHVGCRNCMEPIRRCPTCQKENVEVQPAILARRAISHLPAVCPNEDCGATTTKGELEAHMKICQSKLVPCPSDGCDFEAETEELATHIADKHPERTQQYIVSGLKAAHLEKAKCFLSPCKTEISQQDFWKHIQQNHADELSKPYLLKNRAGVQVKVGERGKFYCNRPNVVHTPTKQSGKCASYSENCGDCMELDLIFRGLKSSVPLKLVNNEGRVCQTDVCTHDVSGTGISTATVPRICGKPGCSRDPVFYCNFHRYDQWAKKFVFCTKDDEICSACKSIGRIQRYAYTSVWN